MSGKGDFVVPLSGIEKPPDIMSVGEHSNTQQVSTSNGSTERLESRSYSRAKSRLIRRPSSIKRTGELFGSLSRRDSHLHCIREDSPNAGAEKAIAEVVEASSQFKSLNKKRNGSKKVKLDVYIEWIMFLCIMALLITSVTVQKLDCKMIWGLDIWKWCVLLLVILCARLVTQWFISLMVCFAGRIFIFNERVLYFIYGVKTSVLVVVWLGLVLMTWALLIKRGVNRSVGTHKVVHYITRTLISTLVGTVLWMLKTVLVKLVASSFHVKQFFERIQKSVFDQYILQTLLGGDSINGTEGSHGCSSSCYRVCFKNPSKRHVDPEKIYKTTRENVSATTMEGLVDVIRSSSFSTISSATHQEEEIEITEDITRALASQIFNNVIARRDQNQYIEEKDLDRFFKKDMVGSVIESVEEMAGGGKITEQSFTKWVENVFKERHLLMHSLNDAKTAIEELNKILSGVILIVIIVVWFIIMGLATTQVLVFISSQLLLVVFIFGNTCKTLFEAIIFVFVTHPFDVGDRCCVDGVQMVVDEMDILKTTFLRYDNEKIYYPNAVLATKPISNFNRSPPMGDTVEFTIDVQTSMDKIQKLKDEIKEYIEATPQYWDPKHILMIKSIEEMNKMKVVLVVNHTINFQDIVEKINRKTELVLKVKEALQHHDISYSLLPQAIHLSYM